MMNERDIKISVVGLGCKFPGANNQEEFLENLRNGVNSVRFIPNDRWNMDHYYDSNIDSPGKMCADKGGFIDGIDEWDYRFHNVSEEEAKHMDPQQKIVLDCVHMAMEDAGITRAKLNDTKTDVIIGCMTDDFKVQAMDVDSTYAVPGSHTSIISARVAYTLNLNGTAITVDTACSSSLVAIDLACQALRLGRCDTVICGGVNLLLDPSVFVGISKARMLSPYGQCKTFTNEAIGYARGEGCGIVILKRLEDAKKDRNKIWGNLYTGTNQDGRNEKPITAPSKRQQKNLLNDVFERYGLDKENIQVIEAHGTGTRKGDPTETNALGEFFRSGENVRGEAKGTIYLGSVKTNIGHLESAAGVAGLVKVLLMMKSGQIFPSLWYSKQNENPELNLNKYNFVIPTFIHKWENSNGNCKMACVNSFGFGGTNAHVVVEEHVLSDIKTVELSDSELFPFAFTLSATDRDSLVKNVKSFQNSLHGNEYTSLEALGALSCTSTCKRDHRIERKVFFANSQGDLQRECQEFVSNPQYQETPLKEKNVIYVFCGVGTASDGMCRSLIQHPVFDEAVRNIDYHLKPLTSWSIVEKFRSGIDIPATDPFMAHIAIFACQVGLYYMWKEIGLTPDIVVGQSVGEIAAAFAGGYIDLKSAVLIAFHRSKLLAQNPKGEMCVIQNLQVTEVLNYIEDLKHGSASIAVVHSSTSCTVSGDTCGIRSLIETFAMVENVRMTKLDVRCGYHSQLVDEPATKLENVLGKHTLTSAKTKCTKMISTVQGEDKNIGNKYLSPSYWKRNVRNPVRMETALKSAFQNDKENIFVEIGPRPVLRAHIEKIISGTNKATFPSMKPKQETKTFIQTAGKLYERGFDIKWNVFLPCNLIVTDIPRYTFQSVPNLHRSQISLLRNIGKTVKLITHPCVKMMPPKDNCLKLKVTLALQTAIQKSNNWVTYLQSEAVQELYSFPRSGKHKQMEKNEMYLPVGLSTKQRNVNN